MINMKKSVILVSALTALTLAGCGNQHQVPKKNYEPKKTVVKSQTHSSSKNDSASMAAASSASSQAQAESSSASAASSSSTQQAWTLDSAKSYYLATVRDNDGNPLQLVGDIPTAAQNGPTVWQNMGTSNNGQTMNVGISGTQIFTITNNGDGTSTIQLGTITMRVRNSDHWILENNQQK